MSSKCVYTIAIDNWFPEMCRITFPLMEAWSKKIGADFKVISRAKFAGFKPNFEKFQIWELGAGYDWNIFIDADMIVDPRRMPDFADCANPKFVYYESWLQPSKHYRSHEYFQRDGRDFGVSDCFLMSSSMTHDLWFPPVESSEVIEACCLHQKRAASEYVLNRNIARFGLKLADSIGHDKHHFHLQTTDDYNRQFNGGQISMTREQHIERALQKLSTMKIVVEV